jgi:hypothetical protein
MKMLLSALFMLGFVFQIGFTSCVGLRYDAASLSAVTALSKSLPALMEKATKPYSASETEANALLSQLDNAISQAASLKKNQDAAEQWRLLKDDLVAPFLSNWKSKGKLDKDFVAEATKQVKASLAAIERTERAKRGAPNR